MITLTPYAWLDREPGPRMLREALALYGTLEMPGAADSPVILGWALELGLSRVYTHDAVPWCGLFLAVVAKRAEKSPPAGLSWEDMLWALNWAHFGTARADMAAMLGDVLVFKRPGGGHVGLYVGEDDQTFHVLGGNQHDQVSITRLDRERAIAVRVPAYVQQPPNVRPIQLAANGAISTNEV